MRRPATSRASNFGRGGADGDALVAVAQGGRPEQRDLRAATPDGQSPDHEHVPVGRERLLVRRRRWRWRRAISTAISTPTSSFTSSTTASSNRLNPDFTGIEADAIGEGGSDFFAYSINGDTTLAEYAAPPNGIRQVNDKTYGSWYCLSIFGFIFCEPHDNGEIWANTLWDLRERFRADRCGRLG